MRRVGKANGTPRSWWSIICGGSGSCASGPGRRSEKGHGGRPWRGGERSLCDCATGSVRVKWCRRNGLIRGTVVVVDVVGGMMVVAVVAVQQQR